MNPRECAMRKLLRVIDTNAEQVGIDPNADAEHIANWLRKAPADVWARLALHAGCRPPSTTTQDLTIMHYYRRTG